MRNLKKFLALVLAMMMALSLMVTANAQNAKKDYQDVADAEFTEAIDVLTGMGVFKGHDGDFRPTETITRAEAAAVLYRLVTGDVEDKQVELYAPQAYRFTDVTPGAWYAGYVGFAVDAGFVKGYNGEFMPSKKVTGYEMLAMLLRAVGYGKNGEFTGDAWRINVGARAQSLKILEPIESTHYGNTLSHDSAREVVAELAFVTATKVPTVTWTQLGGYNEYQTMLTVSGEKNLKNDTLGVKVFGLTDVTGIVVGNQATGEDDTMVNRGYTKDGDKKVYNADSYAYEDAEPTAEEKDGDGKVTKEAVPGAEIHTFGIKTGLGLFGHKVTVWYKAGTKSAYAVIDEATLTATVFAENKKLSTADGKGAALGSAADEKGFDVDLEKSKAYSSDEYGQIDTTAAADAVESPVNMYALISNNGAKTVDVVIALNAEVGIITERNFTAKEPYLILGGNKDSKGEAGNTSNFGNAAEKIWIKKLTADSVEPAVGKLVCAWEVKGTADADDEETYSYQLDDVKTSTKTVKSYEAKQVNEKDVKLDETALPAVTKVNFSDNTSMGLSGITLGDGTNSAIVSRALPIAVNAKDDELSGKSLDLATNLKAGVSYTVYEDAAGRFIGLKPAGAESFIYATYADFKSGELGSGELTYYITGVDENGQKIINHDFTKMGNAALSGKVYSELDIPVKSFGGTENTGSEITTGLKQAYMISTKGAARETTARDGFTLMKNDTWKYSARDTRMGLVTVGKDGAKYLLTENTQFYVVKGSGTSTLEVTPYKGITALLDGADRLEITAYRNPGEEKDSDGNLLPSMDDVVIWSVDEKYGSVNTGNNIVASKVILGSGNLKRHGVQTMYYNFAEQAPTGLILADGSGAEQYKLYSNGKADYFFISEVDGKAVDSDTKLEADTFYQLVKEDEADDGTIVYSCTTADVEDKISYNDGYNTGVTYEYISVANLKNATLSKVEKLLFDVENAVICDVQFLEEATGDVERTEIKTVLDLNRAISVKQVGSEKAQYAVQVAVVYNETDVATIYITALTEVKGS